MRKVYSEPTPLDKKPELSTYNFGSHCTQLQESTRRPPSEGGSPKVGGGASEGRGPAGGSGREAGPRPRRAGWAGCPVLRNGGMGRRALTERGATCAGSPGRRASGMGQSPEVGLVRARPSRQQLAPPHSCPPEPPSSAAARVAEAREVEWRLSSNGSWSREEGL